MFGANCIHECLYLVHWAGEEFPEDLVLYQLHVIFLQLIHADVQNNSIIFPIFSVAPSLSGEHTLTYDYTRSCGDYTSALLAPSLFYGKLSICDSN